MTERVLPIVHDALKMVRTLNRALRRDTCCIVTARDPRARPPPRRDDLGSAHAGHDRQHFLRITEAMNDGGEPRSSARDQYHE